MASQTKYATGTALRTALEQRLRSHGAEHQVSIGRLRKLVAFDRLLVRIAWSNVGIWALKGGYALELRMRQDVATFARTTKDVDLVVGGLNENDLLRVLQAAGEIEARDYFTFNVGVPTAALEARPYGGLRYPVVARMDGREFERFHLDVVIGPPTIGGIEELAGEDWLGFAGIPSAKVPTISPEQHLAEKVHAYSLPQSGVNSRVKDLIDMVLLVKNVPLVTETLESAIVETFAIRGTHPVPERLDLPPEGWREPFAELAVECGLDVAINEGFALVRNYLSPVLLTASSEGERR